MKDKSFIDKLNRLEQLGIFDSKEQWLKLRVIRNELADVYENEPVSMSQTINHVYESRNLLIAIFTKTKNYALKYLS